jgi:hypothetical protein
MDDLMLNGNAAAGLLGEAFTVDVTTAIGACGGCGAREQLGEAHVYTGAGVVLRCPHCNHVLVTVARTSGACGSASPAWSRWSSFSSKP